MSLYYIADDLLKAIRYEQEIHLKVNNDEVIPTVITSVVKLHRIST